MKVYSPSDYGGSAQILTLAHDPIGGIWAGSKGAVFYYSGEAWTKVPTEKGMLVSEISFDEKGRLWVGGKGSMGYIEPVGLDTLKKADAIKGKSLLGRKNPLGSYRYVSIMDQLPDSLEKFKHLWDIHIKGGIAFFNGFEQAFWFNGEKMRVIEPRYRFFHSTQVEGKVWIMDQKNGIYRFDPAALQKKTVQTLPDKALLPGSSFFADKEFRHVEKHVAGLTREGEYLVATGDSGLFAYDPKDPKGKRVRRVASKATPFLKKWKITEVLSLSPERNPWNASLLVSTKHAGILLLDRKGGIAKIIGQEEGLPAANVWESLKGQKGSGIFWCGTNKGIARIHLADPLSYSWEGKELQGAVTGIATPGKDLLVATLQGIFEWRALKKGTPGNRAWKRISGGKFQCFDMIEASFSQGGVIVASGFKGIWHFFKEDGAWKKDRIGRISIYSLSEVPNGQGELFAYGGKNGVGLLRREGKGEWMTPLGSQGYPDDPRFVEAIRPKGRERTYIWVGFTTKGAALLEIQDSVFHPGTRKVHLSTDWEKIRKGATKGLRGVHFERHGLPLGGVRIFERNGKVLAGTDSGLYRPSSQTLPASRKKENGIEFLPANGEVFDLKPLKRGDEAYLLMEEGPRGSVWTNTSRNSYRYSPEKGTLDSIPYRRIIPEKLYAIHPDHKGVLWAGGTQGMVRFDPRTGDRTERAYPCFIQKIEVIGQKRKKKREAPQEQGKRILFQGRNRKEQKGELLNWEPIAQQPPDGIIPHLTYERNALRFHFAAPFFDEEQKIRYSFKLDGFNKGWSPWIKKPQKAYTNLPEGSYTFRVKAKNVYDKVSREMSYRFRILPPWYRTYEAYAGYGLLSMLFI
ncbi:MAG: triple tyrosine motif-containing protein, partial [Flavobacteriales bacterium]